MSNYTLQNDISISLLIGGANFPLNSLNYISSLYIKESVKLLVPELAMTLHDSMGFLNETGLQDGTLLTIIISRSGSIIQSIPFRIFSFSATKEMGTTRYVINAYYNAPKYLMSIVDHSYSGTSASVIQQIAANCNLQCIAKSTNDFQLWTPPLISYAAFARYICRRGFVSNSSCMAVGLNTFGTIVYSDIMSVSPLGTIYANQFTDAKNLGQYDYNCISFNTTSTMGLNNATGGYSTYAVGQSLLYDNKKVTTVTVKNNVKSPAINSVVKSLIDRQRVIHLPIDSGNCHSMYLEAYNQNKRLSKLFTINLDVVLYEPCAISLCSSFNLVATDDKGQPDVGESGVYTVTDRVITIENSHYYEKISACRIGTNNDYYAN